MAIAEPWAWGLAALAGLCLGAFFFGNLWWTLRLTLGSGRSPLWHVGGWLLRMGVTLAGFHAVGGGQWQRLVACLTGFIVARQIVVAMSRNWRVDPLNPSDKQACDASEP